MDFKNLDTYCLSKSGASFSYPFNDHVRVYKVASKMFALSIDETPLSLNLKCDPTYALELRNLYRGISAGYHMNKKHWNTILCNEDVEDAFIYELIDHSYSLVVKSLPKKVQVHLTSTSP